MTAVVALTCGDGSIVLGGDSYCGEDALLDTCAAPKVTRIGSLGVGVSGGVAAESAFLAAVRAFVERGRANLVAELPSLLRAHALDVDGGEYVIASRGAIYLVDEEHGVWRCGRHAQAIGAGGQCALAATFALSPQRPPTPTAARRIVLAALRAVARVHAAVLAPFRTIVVRP